MHRRTAVLFAAAAVGLAAVAAALPAAAAAKAAVPHYYLALGDSLSRGMQPDASGTLRDTNQGYANDLVAIERHRVPKLQLVQLGCGGETTTSMLTGGNKDAKLFHCDPAGAQLAAAVRFLRTHHRPGEVPLVTIDIGANDVDGCGSVSASQIGSCVTTGVATIKQNLPKILAELKKAAPKGTTFAAMNLYDPFLSYYFAPAGSSNSALEPESIALAKVVNGDLAAADTKAGFLTADVAGAFHTYNSTSTATWHGRQVPLDVARLCSWTWACAASPRTSIHANAHGYQVIANAFATAIGDRLH